MVDLVGGGAKLPATGWLRLRRVGQKISKNKKVSKYQKCCQFRRNVDLIDWSRFSRIWILKHNIYIYIYVFFTYAESDAELRWTPPSTVIPYWPSVLWIASRENGSTPRNGVWEKLFQHVSTVEFPVSHHQSILINKILYPLAEKVCVCVCVCGIPPLITQHSARRKMSPDPNYYSYKWLFNHKSHKWI